VRRLRAEYILCVEDEELDRTSRSSGGIVAPVMYTLKGKDKDQLFMARVLQCGPGKLEDGTRRAMCVQRGDMLMMLQNNVSYRVTLQQRPHYVVQNRFVAGVLTEDLQVIPKQHYILVKSDPERARLATIGKGLLHLASVEIDTDDVRRRSGIQAEYGVVLAKGPGAWIDGNWLEAECEVGDLILYDKSHSTVPVMIKGQAYTLVPSDMMIMGDDLSSLEEWPAEPLAS
jgi:co-chaperonin GroES (HSP10)